MTSFLSNLAESTTENQTESNLEKEQHEKALKTSEIIGVVFGSLLLIMVFVWVAFFIKRRKLFHMLSLIPKRKVENTDQVNFEI
jgi:hypothetical protein